MRKTAEDIRRIYQMLAKQVDDDSKWVKMTAVAEHLDVTPEQFSEAVRELLRDEPNFEVCKEINQKTLTRMDRLYRVEFAGQMNDYMVWR